jgi:catechol 2,3-dioxygenase-like lactoylglutathione lyase family enzyme
MSEAGSAGVHVTGVSELVLEVTDLTAAEAFYAGVLGLPVVERWPAREAIWVMAGERTRIGLWKPQVGLAGGRGGVHVHFAMHIAEADYEAAVSLLRERGASVEEIAFDGAGRAAYVNDPDGNVVELWTWDVAGHLG